MSNPASAVVRRLIRVRKEDSAYVYFVLEALEGVASYSTLAHAPGAAYRDLELTVPVGFEQQVDELLTVPESAGGIGDLVYRM